MKKIFISGIIFGMVCACANASDGGVYAETYNQETVYETVKYTNDVAAQPARVSVQSPCMRAASSVDLSHCKCGRRAPVAQPVRVRTFSEVIDHYDVYQPVVEYVPVGTFSERRVVDYPKPCNRCNGK